MKKLIIASLFIFNTSLVFSDSEIRGIGLTKCSTYINSLADEKIIYSSWMAGFISSHNFLLEKIHLKNIGYDRAQIWLEYYCYKNQNTIFKDAVEALNQHGSDGVCNEYY